MKLSQIDIHELNEDVPLTNREKSVNEIDEFSL